MAKSDPCPKCGANMNMVGRAHNCVSRAPVVAARVLRDTPRKGGDRRIGSKKASAPPPAGASKLSEPATPVVKGRGRPPGPKRVPVLLEIEPELLARLDRYRAGSDLPSRQAVIRFLLDGALK